MVRPATRSLVSRVLLASLASLTLFAVTANAHADTSGETGTGYGWTDSQRPSPTVAFQWVDIAESGSRVERLSTCDDCLEGDVPIGFEFSFYGDAYTTVGINSNGVLQFVDAGAHWGPGRLPNHDFLGPAIFPLWGDWDPRSSGNIYVQRLSSWPGTSQRAFIVQWDDVESWDCRRGDNATWQVVLLENGGVIFQYLDTVVGALDCNHGADMTIGLQQGFSECSNTYSHRFASVPDGTAIAWSPQPSDCYQIEPAPTTDEPMPTTVEPTPTRIEPAADEFESSNSGEGGPETQDPLRFPNDGGGPSESGRGWAPSNASVRFLAIAGTVLLLFGLAWRRSISAREDV